MSGIVCGNQQAVQNSIIKKGITESCVILHNLSFDY